MANSKQCPKYPKTNPKKGDRIPNNATPNKPNVNQTQNTPNQITSNNSYANAAKIGHQRSARETGSELAIKRSELDSASKTQNSSCSEIILAIREFKNFFSNHPELLTLGKALRSASSRGKVRHFLRGNGLHLKPFNMNLGRFGLRIASWNANGV
ncbi:hypothetical protein TNCT_673191 [Trichonephila clavata]|uniref:Uncharacterized protein n=1 Tax=Trichonephila clavata TaxID=2740835 RepID=A0A8X6HR68_TRICU|nr:hypothetical protein TNCT_673191 [Trichonephila clavata]